MNKIKKSLGLILGMALAVAIGTADAANINIPQVPSDAAPAGNASEPAVTTNGDAGKKDYQSDVLSNAEISGRARGEAAINSNGGNTAIINQSGDSNISSVIQSGKDNYASQTQKGKVNDLRVEQHGAHNSSQESQIGDYNHKVKIQNGSRSEETTIYQVVYPK